MAQVPNIEKYEGDLLLIRVAREIAVDHYEIPEILKRYSVSDETWRQMQANPRFQNLLHEEIVSWQSATNTAERTKLKAQAMIEEFLPEANAQLHMKDNALNHKVELGKLIASIAGMGQRAGDTAAVGEKFSVTINIGEGREVRLEKSVTPEVTTMIDYGAEDL